MKRKEQLEKLRSMTREELLKRAKELKKELFNLRFQSTQAQLTNPKRFREVRKEISRIYTILRERELKLR